MTNQSISSLLKQLRKTSAFSANDVVNRLKEYDIDISAKTLYGYESGLSMPNADTFIALCKIYKCDNPLDIFGSSTINPSEQSLLEKYRDLDDHGKELVDLVLEKEHERCIASITEKPAALRIYTYMQKIAAAGNGFYFDDIPTETIEAPYMPGADFIIGVSGDSMEPTYNDGDLVYVEKRQIIHSGEIGIFMIHNELYIKEVTDEGLKSHNPKYKIIPGDESIQCIGKVLGKVDMNA